MLLQKKECFHFWKIHSLSSTNTNCSLQIKFFNIHPSSWFTIREFLTIYNSKLERSFPFSPKDEYSIECIALEKLEEGNEKPKRRYYRSISWTISQLFVLEQSVEQYLLSLGAGVKSSEEVVQPYGQQTTAETPVDTNVSQFDDEALNFYSENVKEEEQHQEHSEEGEVKVFTQAKTQSQ